MVLVSTLAKACYQDPPRYFFFAPQNLPFTYIPFQRVLSVAGVADAIHIATYYIGNILIEAQERQPSVAHSTYRPLPHSSSTTPRGGGGGRGPPSSSSSYSNGGGGGGGGSSYIPSYASNYAPPPQPHPPPPPPADGPLQTQQIYIPNDLVGCIIGKGGSKINEIRTFSQSTIKIMEPGAVGVGMNGAPTSGGRDERLVVITGAGPNIQMAVSMLYAVSTSLLMLALLLNGDYQRLEEEKDKQLRSNASPI